MGHLCPAYIVISVQMFVQYSFSRLVALSRQSLAFLTWLFPQTSLRGRREKKKGWKTASGKQVLNQDSWKELDAARIEGVKFKYIKDPVVHTSDPDKEDKLATKYYNKELLPLQSHDNTDKLMKRFSQ